MGCDKKCHIGASSSASPHFKSRRFPNYREKERHENPDGRRWGARPDLANTRGEEVQGSEVQGSEVQGSKVQGSEVIFFLVLR